MNRYLKWNEAGCKAGTWRLRAELNRLSVKVFEVQSIRGTVDWDQMGVAFLVPCQTVSSPVALSTWMISMMSKISRKYYCFTTNMDTGLVTSLAREKNRRTKANIALMLEHMCTMKTQKRHRRSTAKSWWRLMVSGWDKWVTSRD